MGKMIRLDDRVTLPEGHAFIARHTSFYDVRSRGKPITPKSIVLGAVNKVEDAYMFFGQWGDFRDRENLPKFNSAPRDLVNTCCGGEILSRTSNYDRAYIADLNVGGCITLEPHDHPNVKPEMTTHDIIKGRLRISEMIHDYRRNAAHRIKVFRYLQRDRETSPEKMVRVVRALDGDYVGVEEEGGVRWIFALEIENGTHTRTIPYKTSKNSFLYMYNIVNLMLYHSQNGTLLTWDGGLNEVR